MTAVEWLVKELKKVHHPTEAMIMYAKNLEKQQIIDAQMDMFHYLNDAPYGMEYLSKLDTVIEFCKTYGSKGSDNSKNNIQ